MGFSLRATLAPPDAVFRFHTLTTAEAVHEQAERENALPPDRCNPEESSCSATGKYLLNRNSGANARAAEAPVPFNRSRSTDQPGRLNCLFPHALTRQCFPS